MTPLSLLGPLLVALAVPPSEMALYITTPEPEQITIHPAGTESGAGRAIGIGERSLAVCLREGATVSVDVLSSPAAPARIDGDRVTWRGDIELTISNPGGIHSRMSVEDGTVELAPAGVTASGTPHCIDYPQPPRR